MHDEDFSGFSPVVLCLCFASKPIMFFFSPFASTFPLTHIKTLFFPFFSPVQFVNEISVHVLLSENSCNH